MAGWTISLDTRDPDAIPYFNWDSPVTNAAVRRALTEGTEDDKLPTAPIPAGSSASEIDAFRSELIAAFTRMALPSE